MMVNRRVKVRSPEASIAKWYQGKCAAIALTFDDWTPGQITLAVPALEQQKLSASFYITTHNMQMWPAYNHWERLKDLVAADYEVGNHTVNHKDLTSLSQSERMWEIYHAKKAIDSHLANASVETFAYPFGKFNAATIDDVMHGHIGARTFDPQEPTHMEQWPQQMDQYAKEFHYDFATSEKDYYVVHQLRVYKETSPAQLGKFFTQVIKNKGLLPLVFHGVYSDDDRQDFKAYDSIHQTQLDEILKQVKNIEQEVWLTTFGNAIKYHRAVKNSSINLHWCQQYDNGGARYEFLLKSVDAFDVALHPLSISIKLEAGYRCDWVSQNEQSLEYREKGNTIEFEVSPKESILAIRVEKSCDGAKP